MSNIDIDNLVQNILSDLNVGTNGELVRPILVAEESRQENNNRNEIYIDSRVVSLADLKGKIDGATKLFIAPKSVLTPSAKDEIRKRKIEIAVRLPGLTVDRGSPLWLAVHGTNVLSPNIISRLQRDFKADLETFACLTELVFRAEERLFETKTFGVALTRQAASLLVELNRKSTIRAISAIDTIQVDEDLKEVNANLIVVHPDRVSETKLFEIVKKYSIR